MIGLVVINTVRGIPVRQEPVVSFIGNKMSKKKLTDQITEIDEHISHLLWRCDNTIVHSELKKLKKTIKSLNKSRLKLSKKLPNERDIHDEIT
jgi:hypothetical protein